MDTTHDDINGESSDRRASQQAQMAKARRRMSLSRAEVLAWAQSMITQQTQNQPPNDTRTPTRRQQ